MDITTQEKEYKKKLNRLMKKVMLKPSKITENLTEIINLLEEMSSVGVITNSQKEKYINRIYREMNAPEEFREWIRKKFKQMNFLRYR